MTMRLRGRRADKRIGAIGDDAIHVDVVCGHDGVCGDAGRTVFTNKHNGKLDAHAGRDITGVDEKILSGVQIQSLREAARMSPTLRRLGGVVL